MIFHDLNGNENLREQLTTLVSIGIQLPERKCLENMVLSKIFKPYSKWEHFWNLLTSDYQLMKFLHFLEHEFNWWK
jgi:hypothetical protein